MTAADRVGRICAYGEAQDRRLIISLSIATRDHGHKFEAAGTTVLRLAGMPPDLCLLEACQDMLIVSKPLRCVEKKLSQVG